MIEKAKKLATELHNGQVRKGTDIPYITHPLAVYNILLEMGASEDLLCAGLLHDTVEDAGFTIDEIRKKFNSKIADLVAGHTEDKSLSWKVRKEIDLEHLKNADKDFLMLVFADKLANARDTYNMWLEIGDKVWERFNADKKMQEWYYNEGVKAFCKMGDYDNTKVFYDEYKGIVEKLFKSKD